MHCKGIVVFSFFAILLVASCKKEENISGLRIEIGNGTVISGDDVEFYDSSSCILFLKKAISVRYNLTGFPEYRHEIFKVKINGEMIFSGYFFPYDVEAPPPSPIYIGCFGRDSLNSDFIKFEFAHFPFEAVDNRNDSRIIHFFERRKQLRKGISCHFESIGPSPIDNAFLTIDFAIKNNDSLPYLIPDLSKMSVDQFQMLTGGFFLDRLDSAVYYYHKIYAHYDTTVMSLDNLTMVGGKEERIFRTSVPYTLPITKGSYRCWVEYGNFRYLDYIHINLNQDQGRVWIGNCQARIYFGVD